MVEVKEGWVVAVKGGLVAVGWGAVVEAATVAAVHEAMQQACRSHVQYM